MDSSDFVLSFEELEKVLKTKHQCDKKTIRKHGWDELDRSPNIDVQHDNQLAVRNSTSNTSDGIRGCIGYKGGNYLFEFEWKPGANKHVVIGIATRKAKLKAEGCMALIGSDEYSLGWDLVNRCIRFNNTTIKTYPSSVDTPIPSKITMSLNMGEGTVAFRSGSHEYGTAMKGLRHLNKYFYVAASMDKPDDSMRITFLGDTDRAKQYLLLSKLLTSGHRSSKPDIAFHPICGSNIDLSDDNRVAERRNIDETMYNATVLSSRPLRINESFTVRCDARDKRRHGAWIVGATNVKPEELQIQKDMTRVRQGKRWLYNEHRIMYNNKTQTRTDVDLDDLRSGDRVSIKRCEEEVEFSVNGELKGNVTCDKDEDIYGCVDVFGRTVRVSLIEETGDKSRAGTMPRKKVSSTTDAVLAMLPKTSDEFLIGIHSTAELLKDRDPENISKIRQHLKMKLLVPFASLTSDAVKVEGANVLGQIEGAAQNITEYMAFLRVLGLDSGENIYKSYSTLLSVVINFGDKSLLLCKKFGESGLVATMIKDIHRFKESAHQSNVDAELLEEYCGVLHNCAKAADNRPIYRNERFLEIGKHYASTQSYGAHTQIMACLAMSYICDDDQFELLNMVDETAEKLVTILEKAASNKRSDGTYNHGGFHCYEIAVGISNLSKAPDNIERFIKYGVLEHLVKMLTFANNQDKECSLNAIWSLATPTTKKRITQAGSLSLRLRSLASHENEGVKQAAIRLLTRLVHMTDSEPKKASMKRQCAYKASCDRFKTEMNLPDAYFDPSGDACYCAECHGLRGDEAYYSEGRPAKRYALPVGWCKYGLRMPARAEVHKVEENWHRAYHGTKQDHVEGILSVGEIIPAGRPVLGGLKIIEGSGHFHSLYKPTGFDTKRVFLSPSIRYSGVDAYAKPKVYKDKTSGTCYKSKVVFQVFIEQDSYEVGPQTLGATDEIDPEISNQELEWCTNMAGSCILQGLLVKLIPNDEE